MWKAILKAIGKKKQSDGEGSVEIAPSTEKEPAWRFVVRMIVHVIVSAITAYGVIQAARSELRSDARDEAAQQIQMLQELREFVREHGGRPPMDLPAPVHSGGTSTTTLIPRTTPSEDEVREILTLWKGEDLSSGMTTSGAESAHSADTRQAPPWAQTAIQQELQSHWETANVRQSNRKE